MKSTIAHIVRKHLVVAIAAAAAALTLAGCTLPKPRHYLVYSHNQSQQFGSVDIAKGKFTQIGPDLPEGETGLVTGPAGTLLTLGYSGTLYSINPATGIATPVGPTGMTDCIGPPSSPCSPDTADNLAILGPTIFANDFGTRLYTVNPTTGQTTLVGNTGIPGALSTVDTVNPDGTLNAFDFTLFSANGRLYATSDSTVIDFNKLTSVEIVPASLYEIDTTTGKATRIAATTPNLTAVVNVDGVIYAYYALHSQWVTLSLTDGSIHKVSDDADPSVGPTFGGDAVEIP